MLLYNKEMVRVEKLLVEEKINMVSLLFYGKNMIHFRKVEKDSFFLYKIYKKI